VDFFLPKNFFLCFNYFNLLFSFLVLVHYFFNHSIFVYFSLTLFFFSISNFSNFLFSFLVLLGYSHTQRLLWLDHDWAQSFVSRIAVLSENAIHKWLHDILSDTTKKILWFLSISFYFYFEIWNEFLKMEVSLIFQFLLMQSILKKIHLLCLPKCGLNSILNTNLAFYIFHMVCLPSYHSTYIYSCQMWWIIYGIQCSMHGVWYMVYFIKHYIWHITM